MTTPPREARLRAEFAHLYPGLDTGVWYTAATLAEHLLTRAQMMGRDDLRTGGRVLDDAHFEFRGGAASALPRRGARARREDGGTEPDPAA